MPDPVPTEVFSQDGDALLLVDVQEDFLPNGALGVPGGDAVVPVLNRWIDAALEARVPIVATRDWHPADHVSFEAQGGPWPPHCVQGTPGAAFATDLALPTGAVIVSKATTPPAEAYSGFDGTDLTETLREMGVERLWVGGLATDYCVKETVTDALAVGFEVHLIPGGHAGIEDGTSADAMREMAAAGAANA